MKSLLVSIMVLGAVAAALLPAPGVKAQDEDVRKAYGNTYDIMEILFEPLWTQLQEGMATEPERRREWSNLKKASLGLAELHNLVYMRTDEDYVGDPSWRELTVLSHEATVKVMNAVEDKAEYTQLKQDYEAMVDACNKCHTKFEPDVAPVLKPYKDAAEEE